MPMGKMRSINHASQHPSMWLLTAAVCLWPAVASAGSLGAHDTATGSGALANEDSANGGDFNTADGANALYLNTTGGSNIASGYGALFSNTTGSYNTASGYAALYSNTTGIYNTASGAFALYLNTTGKNNTANGLSALYNNTTGYDNTASGFQALGSNTTGYANTASGFNALALNTTGYGNIASGYYALYSNTTGIGNIALGWQALYANKGGNQNVAVGTNARLKLTSGNQNIALGLGAGGLTTSGSINLYIGNPGINGSESNVIRIGTGQTKTFIAGISGTALSGATVVVNSNGQLGVVTSSARYKKDIKPLAGASAGAKLAQLRPVSFRYKSEPVPTHYGLIAEEVEKVMPELVVRDKQNRPDSVQYIEIVPLLLQQWKAQQAEIARQSKLNARQEAENARLRNLVERQNDRLDRQEKELAELRHALATRLAALDVTAPHPGPAEGPLLGRNGLQPADKPGWTDRK